MLVIHVVPEYFFKNCLSSHFFFSLSLWSRRTFLQKNICTYCGFSSYLPLCVFFVIMAIFHFLRDSVLRWWQCYLLDRFSKRFSTKMGGRKHGGEWKEIKVWQVVPAYTNWKSLETVGNFKKMLHPVLRSDIIYFKLWLTSFQAEIFYLVLLLQNWMFSWLMCRTLVKWKCKFEDKK